MNDIKNKTFDDLNFLPHGNHPNAIQARLFLKSPDLGYDGFEISVVTSTDGKHGLYGHESAGTYEVAMFHNNSMLPLSVSDDVLGWQDSVAITRLMRDAQLNGVAWVKLLKELRTDWRKDLDLKSPHYQGDE
jgi:hypothetical protein